MRGKGGGAGLSVSNKRCLLTIFIHLGLPANTKIPKIFLFSGVLLKHFWFSFTVILIKIIAEQNV